MMCKKNESGAILVVVLWVVILLTVLLTGFLSVSRLERQFTNEIIDRIETRSAAEAVLAYLSAIYPLDNNEWSNILGRNLYLPMPNKINFKVIPEDSFISLNGASRSTLDKFFLKFIPDEIEREHLVSVILSRGSERLAKEPIPEFWYSVEEILLIDNVDSTALQSALTWLTVDSNHDGVNHNYADVFLIESLFPDLLETIISARNSGVSLPGVTSTVVSSSDIGRRSRLLSGGDLPVFRVQIEIENGGRRHRLEIAAQFVDQNKGYEIKRWNEYNPAFSLSD